MRYATIRAIKAVQTGMPISDAIPIAISSSTNPNIEAMTIGHFRTYGAYSIGSIVGVPGVLDASSKHCISTPRLV